MIDAKTEYLLARARQEALRASEAEHPAAAAAHRDLAKLYSVKAVIELGDEDDKDRDDDS